MLNLPEEYSGKLVALFEAGVNYPSDSFFKNEGVHITESPLGTYIETSNEPLSRFGYRFKIKNKNKPHMLVVAYPDDKRRYMMINDCFSYDLSCGVFTDSEYPVSNRVKKIHKIFHTRTEDLTVTVMSWGKNEPAAIFGLAVYELDALDEKEIKKPSYPTNRMYGIQYEDPCGVLSDLGATTLEEWTDRYIEFAKHTGLNTIVQPINWYAGPMYDSAVQPPSLNYWLALENHDQYTVVTSNPQDWITPFLDKCEDADIDFIGGLTLLRLGNLMKNMNVSLESIYAGEDTYNNMRADNSVQASTNDWTRIYNSRNYEKMVNEGKISFSTADFEFIYGEKPDKLGAGPMFNPLHPEVERQLVEYFEEISERYGRKKAFKGLSINVWHSTVIWFSSIFIGYDDCTAALFERETGIRLSFDSKDPERFSKRYNYLMRRCRDTWIEWRCKKIRELILKLRDALRKTNKNLNLYICAWNEPVKRTMYGDLNESMQYPTFISENEFLREGGIDISLFENDEGICFSTEQNQQRDRGWTADGSDLPTEQTRFFHDLAYVDKSWIESEKRIKNNGAFIFDSWVEGWGDYHKYPFNVHTPEIDNSIEINGIKNPTFFKDTCRMSPDGFWFDSQRQITSCYPTDENYMEPLAHAVAELDPMYLFRGGLYLDQSHAKYMRSYSDAFVPLPQVKFNDVQGAYDPVTLREKSLDGKHYLYAVNREPYEIRVKLTLEHSCICHEICREGKDSAPADEITFTLPPFSMKSYVCEADNSIADFRIDVPKNESDELISKYEEQLKIFKWIKENQKGLFGIGKIEQQMKSARDANHLSRLRHLLKCYVSVKAREIYKTHSKQITY